MNAAQLVRQDKRDLDRMGGIKAFMDPSSMQPLIEQFQTGLDKFTMGPTGGERGRGAIQLLKSWESITGQTPEGGGAAKSMQDMAIGEWAGLINKIGIPMRRQNKKKTEFLFLEKSSNEDLFL